MRLMPRLRPISRAFLTSHILFGVLSWTWEAGFRHESLAMVPPGRAIELFKGLTNGEY